MENLSLKAEQEGWKQKIFEMKVEGDFKPEDISFEIVEPGTRFMRSPESEAFIEEKWQEHIKINKPWPKDTVPTKYHLAETRVEDGKLLLILDPCISYKDLICAAHKEFADRFGLDFVPNVLAATTLVTAKNTHNEERILMTLRNTKTNYKPLGYHASVGGYMEIEKDKTPTDAVYRELSEEAGITSEEVIDLVCQGIAYTPNICVSDILFKTPLGISVEEIISRRKHYAREHNLSEEEAENSLLFIPAERRKIQEWLLGTVHAGAAAGIANLLEYGCSIAAQEKDDQGNIIDGEQWKAKMLTSLAWRSADYNSDQVKKQLEARDVARLKQRVDSTKDTKIDELFDISES